MGLFDSTAYAGILPMSQTPFTQTLEQIVQGFQTSEVLPAGVAQPIIEAWPEIRHTVPVEKQEMMDRFQKVQPPYFKGGYS